MRTVHRWRCRLTHPRRSRDFVSCFAKLIGQSSILSAIVTVVSTCRTRLHCPLGLATVDKDPLFGDPHRGPGKVNEVCFILDGNGHCLLPFGSLRNGQ